MKTKSKYINQLTWKVFHVDINDNLVAYDVFHHTSFKNKVVELFENAASFNYFKESLERVIRYYYNSKCEYEMLVSGWPPVEGKNKTTKISWADQVYLNLNVFASYIWKTLEGDFTIDDRYFLFTLDNYFVPPIVSSTKEYFGRINDMAMLVNNPSNHALVEPFKQLKAGHKVNYYAGQLQVPFAKPATLIASRTVDRVSDIQYSFENTYGFTYTIEIESLETTRYAFRVGKKYYLAYSATIKNAFYHDETNETRKEVLGGRLWGFPGMFQVVADQDSTTLTNNLLIKEAEFETREAILNAMNTTPINLHFLFEDVFGDG